MLKHTISFQNAFRGIWVAITTQANLRIHFLIASFVLVTATYLHCSIFEMLVLVLTIMVVMLAEMINTAIEAVCDAITRETHQGIKAAKDVAAGAVLVSAIFASIIGCMIFLPKLIKL